MSAPARASFASRRSLIQETFVSFLTGDVYAVAVEPLGPTDEVVITGCSADCVETVASMDGRITTLLNPDELLKGIERWEAGEIVRLSLDVAKEVGAAGINIRHSLVATDLIARATEVGVAVWAYVIDDERRFGELVDMGVGSLTTNWPARMFKVAREGAAR